MYPLLLDFLAQSTVSGPALAAPSTGGASSTGDLLSGMYPMIMLGLVFVFMYFFVIRPQKKEEKRKTEMLSALKKGDQVITTSGILGSIATVKDDTVILKVGDGARLEFLRSAISAIRNPAAPGKSESN